MGDEEREQESLKDRRKKTKKGKRRAEDPPEEESLPKKEKLNAIYRMLQRYNNRIGLLEQTIEKSERISVDSEMPEVGPSKSKVFNITNLTIERPKFPNKTLHPITFIENLEAYIKKTDCGARKIETAIECLEDEARDWARVYKSRWLSFDDFKADFLETYWSEMDQAKVRRDLITSVWELNTSMLKHFMRWAGKAKMLTVQIPERQLVADIMRHFPKNIWHLWKLARGNTLIAAIEFLRDIDDGDDGNVTSMEKAIEPSKEKVFERPNYERKRFEDKRKEITGQYRNWKRPEPTVKAIEPNVGESTPVTESQGNA